AGSSQPDQQCRLLSSSAIHPARRTAPLRPSMIARRHEVASSIVGELIPTACVWLEPGITPCVKMILDHPGALEWPQVSLEGRGDQIFQTGWSGCRRRRAPSVTSRQHAILIVSLPASAPPTTTSCLGVFRTPAAPAHGSALTPAP